MWKGLKVSSVKKLTVIFICLVISLMCTGVAYASWAISSDVIVNAGTADLDIEIVRATANSSSKGVSFSSSDITIGENGKVASVNMDGIYPGSNAQLEIVIKNIGTMPVHLDMIIQQFNDVIDTKNGDNLGTNPAILKYMVVNYKVYLLDENGFSVQSLSSITASGESVTSEIYKDNSLMAIEPNQCIKIVMDIGMDENAGNETMSKSFSFIVSPIFTQN